MDPTKPFKTERTSLTKQSVSSQVVESVLRIDIKLNDVLDELDLKLSRWTSTTLEELSRLHKLLEKMPLSESGEQLADRIGQTAEQIYGLENEATKKFLLDRLRSFQWRRKHLLR